MTSQHRGSVHHLLHFRKRATIAISQAARDRAVDHVVGPSLTHLAGLSVGLILFEISMSSRATRSHHLWDPNREFKKWRSVLLQDDRRKTCGVSSSTISSCTIRSAEDKQDSETSHPRVLMSFRGSSCSLVG